MTDNATDIELLEREGDLAADYIEGLLDIVDLDGDLDLAVLNGRAVVSVTGGEYFGVSFDDLTGPGRSKDIAFARQVAMYLCRELTNLSLPKIGSFFGGRDHSTVLHATKKISQLLSSNAKVYTIITELTTKIKTPSKTSRR